MDLDGDFFSELIDLTGDDLSERRDFAPILTVDPTNHNSVVSARTPLGVTVKAGDCVECYHDSQDAFLRVVRIT